jgi:hypothetical protein
VLSTRVSGLFIEVSVLLIGAGFLVKRVSLPLRLRTHSTLRKSLRLGAGVSLVVLALVGMSSGVGATRQSTTTTQEIQALSQLAYGVLSVAVLLTSFRWK